MYRCRRSRREKTFSKLVSTSTRARVVRGRPAPPLLPSERVPVPGKPESPSPGSATSTRSRVVVVPDAHARRRGSHLIRLRCGVSH